MSRSDLLSDLIFQIEKGEDISPFLFLWQGLELVNSEVKSLWFELLSHYDIPKTYFSVLEDSWEKLKVSEVKRFFDNANLVSSYRFQIFFVENISRLTMSAWNSLLKLLEEPWTSNLIFLSNASESLVLDTILSRVQTKNISGARVEKRSEFFQNMLWEYIKNNSPEILSYFFRNKLEKTEYTNFLENLIIYSRENMKYIDRLEEINDDLNMVWLNNVNPRWVVDKWLVLIK